MSMKKKVYDKHSFYPNAHVVFWVFFILQLFTSKTKSKRGIGRDILK